MSGRLFAVVMMRRRALAASRVREFFGPEWGQIATVIAGPDTWNAPVEYQFEMGGAVAYLVVVFDRTVTARGLVRLKQSALSIESRTLRAAMRTLNVNPGIATGEGVLVASHKPKPYRIRLATDVWGQWVLAGSGRNLRPIEPIFSEYFEEIDRFAELCGSMDATRPRRLDDAA